MSLYKTGAQTALTPVVGAEPTEKKFPVALSLALTGAIFVGIYAIDRGGRKSTRRRGPDTSDIEAAYRRRGIDPRKAGF